MKPQNLTHNKSTVGNHYHTKLYSIKVTFKFFWGYDFSNPRQGSTERRRSGRPGFPNPLFPSFVSQKFAHQPRRPGLKTGTSTSISGTEMRASKIKDGADVDVLRSPDPSELKISLILSGVFYSLIISIVFSLLQLIFDNGYIRAQYAISVS